MTKTRKDRFTKGKGRWIVLLAIVGLLAAACSTGSYPVDVFTEMHYQQSYKSQEPPRLMPAAEAVVFTEESLALRPLEPATQGEALATDNPVTRNSDSEARAKRIYARNCAVCHGLEGRSDTFISVSFKSLEVKPPADFMTAGSIAASPTDGLAFWFISDGLGNMPAFRDLLTYEDRWTVIHYLRVLSEQASQ